MSTRESYSSPALLAILTSVTELSLSLYVVLLALILTTVLQVCGDQRLHPLQRCQCGRYQNAIS
jgi:hypothetical protein